MIRNINQKWGTFEEFEDIEEMEEYILNSGYELPLNGLELNVDYEYINSYNQDCEDWDCLHDFGNREY